MGEDGRRVPAVQGVGGEAQVDGVWWIGGDMEVRRSQEPFSRRAYGSQGRTQGSNRRLTLVVRAAGATLVQSHAIPAPGGLGSLAPSPRDLPPCLRLRRTLLPDRLAAEHPHPPALTLAPSRVSRSVFMPSQAGQAPPYLYTASTI